MTAVPDKTDVFVVGGGPAGLAAAIAARLKGFDVTVADGAHPPIDKACGEGLMPDSFSALHRLGIRLDVDQSYAFRGIRFVGEGTSVEADFPSGAGIAMRRTRLHEALIDRAVEVGVSLLWGTRVTGLSNEGVSLDRQKIRCRWVIGADGQNSRVRRWANLDGVRHESFRFGFRRHYRLSPWTDYMETYWGSGSQMYVTPVNQSEVCVVLITRDAPAAGAGAAAIPGAEPAAGWRELFHNRTGGGYRIAQLAASLPRQHYPDRRCSQGRWMLSRVKAYRSRFTKLLRWPMRWNAVMFGAIKLSTGVWRGVRI